MLYSFYSNSGKPREILPFLTHNDMEVQGVSHIWYQSRSDNTRAYSGLNMELKNMNMFMTNQYNDFVDAWQRRTREPSYLSGPQGSKEVCEEDKNEYHDKVCYHFRHGLKPEVAK